MTTIIESHIAIVRVIAPMIGAFVACFLNCGKRARILITVVVAFTAALDTYSLLFQHFDKRYIIGGFVAPIGIEYNRDILSNITLAVLSYILLFTLLFCKKDFTYQIEVACDKKYHPIIYAMIALIYAGFSGIVSTDDLFNLYVSLEIASIASYALFTQHKDKRAFISAMEYLTIGTIGASLILVSLGIIYTHCGILSISHIHSLINTNSELFYKNRSFIIAICIFITGCLLKIALFPLHFWIIKSYRFVASSVLTFIAPSTSVVSFYLLIRTIYYIFDATILYQMLNLGNIIFIMSSCAILVNSYLAIKQTKIKSIIIYSAVAQVGYVMLSIMHQSPDMLAIGASCLLNDIIIKMSLFMIVGSIEHLEQNSGNKNIFLILVFLTILSNASMPLTLGFLNKVNLLSTFIEISEYRAFIVMILGSVLSIGYNYKLMYIIINTVNKNKNDINDTGGSTMLRCNIDNLRLFVLNVVSFASLFYNSKLLHLAHLI